MFISSRPKHRLYESATWVLATFVACTSEPGAGGDGDSEGGGAGDDATGGIAGSISGGAGGTTSGNGGRAGTSTGTGGRRVGGSDAGGAAGSGDGDPGGHGGDPGGHGGSAGQGEIPEWPRVGDPCTIANYFACPEPQAVYRLRCNGSTWERSNECATDQLCNRLTGECKGITCDPGEVECTIDLSAERPCGPDRVTIETHVCAFICRDTVGCVEPGDGQVFVDRPREIEASWNEWPNPTIPVCLEDPSDWSAEDLASVRDTFYRNWGRHAFIGLTDFGACAPNAEGVVLALAEACDNELARIPHVGYLGPSVVPVTLCKSYRDSNGQTRVIGRELFEHAVRHVMGHVVGRQDTPYSNLGDPTMMQGIDLSQVRPFALSSQFIGSMQVVYGTAPPRSLGGPNWRCLSVEPGSNELIRQACDGSDERSFRSVDGRFEHVATGECLRLVDGDRVGLGDCAGAERWEPKRVAWLAHAARCVTVKQPENALVPLVIQACAASAATYQTFGFEFPAPNRARIRFGNDRCVRFPDDWSQRNTPLLGSCGDSHALFDTSRGALEAAGRCLTDSSSELRFTACSNTSRYQRFGLSGPLERETGDDALTFLLNGNGVELRSTPLVGAPSEAQTFDYYF